MVSTVNFYLKGHTLQHELYLFRGFVIGSLCSVMPDTSGAGFEHTLAGKVREGCVPSLPALRTKRSFFPMQHHSLIVNTTWKTAHAIFSNGCYEEDKIVVWRKTGSRCDTWYQWLEDLHCVKRLVRLQHTVWSKMQFFCLKGVELYNQPLGCSFVVTFTTLEWMIFW